MGPSGEGEKEAVMWASPRQGNGEEGFQSIWKSTCEPSEACTLGREAGLWGKVWFGSRLEDTVFLGCKYPDSQWLD